MTAATLGAAGKVCTGFSKPYVAKYNFASNAVTYSNGQILARGVDVSIEPETSDANTFWADNVQAETAGGQLTGGTLNVTVDGLLKAAEQLISGLPAADSDGWTYYGDNQVVPFIGFGFVARFMSGGVVCYTPIVLLKVLFDQISNSAATEDQGEIDWQTQSLSAAILRSDAANHNWKAVGNDYTTEAEAEADIKALFNIS